MWIKTDQKVIRSEDVKMLHCENVKSSEDFYVMVETVEGDLYRCSNVVALDVLHQICPSFLEGMENVRFVKKSWAYHNLIAHPWMYVLYKLGFKKKAFEVHNHSILKPIGIKSTQKK